MTDNGLTTNEIEAANRSEVTAAAAIIPVV